MVYDYKNEYRKWIHWKQREEKKLIELGVDQSIIDELRKYDYEQFKAERRYKTKNLLFDDSFFVNHAVFNNTNYYSLISILDDIENETLFNYLKHTDKSILQIIMLRIQGFSIKEISKITGLTTHQIYKKIKKVKKVYISGEKPSL